MIGFLRGTIISNVAQSIIIETAGVGYIVSVPQGDAYPVGTQGAFFIYTHWSQENGMSLFGFTTEMARQIFVLLIGCPGIGPKVALNICADFSPEAIVEIIVSGNVKLLSRVNGIGAKKAESCILYLKDKVQKLARQPEFALTPLTANLNEVSEALNALGYGKSEVHNALEYTKAQVQTNDSFDHLLRAALSFLAGRMKQAAR